MKIIKNKQVLIFFGIIVFIFGAIQLINIIGRYQEKKLKASIVSQLKTLYDKEFVVKEESSTEGVRWTVGLSKWKKTSYICYRKDIPEIEFEVDFDKMGKTVEADNYQRKRIEYEAMQYYKPYFDAISYKYYIVVDIRFNEKGATSEQFDLLQEVDMPLYLELHKKSFKEIIEKYSDYIKIAFAGRIYTDINKTEIENMVENLAKEIEKTKNQSISFSFGIYNPNIYEGYEREKIKGWQLNKSEKGLRGQIREGEYWKQDDKEKTIKKIREAWRWQ